MRTALIRRILRPASAASYLQPSAFEPGFIYMRHMSVFPSASWWCTIKKKSQLTSCIVIQMEARQWSWFAGVRLREAQLILSGPRSAPQASSFSNMVSLIAHRGITKHTPVTSQQHSHPAMNTPGINTKISIGPMKVVSRGSTYSENASPFIRTKPGQFN